MILYTLLSSILFHVCHDGSNTYFDTQVARIFLFVFYFYHMYAHFDQVSKHLTFNTAIRSLVVSMLPNHVIWLEIEIA